MITHDAVGVSRSRRWCTGTSPAALCSPLEVRVDPVKRVAVAVWVLQLHAAGEA